MSETRTRNPVAAGWLVAIVGLLIAGALGYLLMWLGANRLEAAKRTEQPYHRAFAYLAQNALASVGQAEASLKASNWGQAQTSLDEASRIVTAMERAASEPDAGRVRDVRAALADAQTATGAQDKDAPNKLAGLRQRLEAFTAVK